MANYESDKRKGKKSRHTMPVSLEDEELFPRSLHQLKKSPTAEQRFETTIFSDMYTELSRIWWSRLVIAVRGYVSNLCQAEQDDETLFAIDDAFIQLHQSIAEGDEQLAAEMLSRCHVLQCLGGAGSGERRWRAGGHETSFRQLFGTADNTERTRKQSYAYLIFYEVYLRLQARWLVQSKKKKAVSFQEDPEWQPDDRVVVFHEFYPGNRTWVLSDFDRHVIQVWKPFGVNVIFGDRYVQSKRDEGFRLCVNCGMLETQRGQFPGGGHVFYCSDACLDENERRNKRRESPPAEPNSNNEEPLFDPTIVSVRPKSVSPGAAAERDSPLRHTNSLSPQPAGHRQTAVEKLVGQLKSLSPRSDAGGDENKQMNADDGRDGPFKPTVIMVGGSRH